MVIIAEPSLQSYSIYSFYVSFMDKEPETDILSNMSEATELLGLEAEI